MGDRGLRDVSAVRAIFLIFYTSTSTEYLYGVGRGGIGLRLLPLPLQGEGRGAYFLLRVEEPNRNLDEMRVPRKYET
jgi:hypothetical protein